MDWPDMEAKTRAALARAKNVTSHVAWLDVMSDIPSGALPCALDEIERLRGVLAERDRTIQAMTEASQSVIDRAAAVQPAVLVDRPCGADLAAGEPHHSRRHPPSDRGAIVRR